MKDAWEYNTESYLLQLKTVDVILMLKDGLLQDQNTMTLTMKKPYKTMIFLNFYFLGFENFKPPVTNYKTGKCTVLKKWQGSTTWHCTICHVIAEQNNLKVWNWCDFSQHHIHTTFCKKMDN